MPTLDSHAIHFDLDGTLVETTASFDRLVTEAATRAGASAVPVDSFGQLFLEVLHTESEPIATAANRTIPDVDPNAFQAAFMEAEVRETTALPGSKTTLEQLAGNAPIGVLTNGVGRLQRRKLAATGLDEYVDTIVVSGEIGCGKPNPGIYRTAAERLSADHRTFVADNYERDLRPARDRGWDIVYVGTRDNLPETVTCIEDLTALLEVIGID